LLARIDLSRSVVRVDENPPLYDCIREALSLAGPPNIEGATVVAERLRLFHRGLGQTRSASVELPTGVLYGETPTVLATQSFELGSIEGIRLELTDVAAVSEQRAVFTAAAENTIDAVLDGPITGSAIGIFEAARGTLTARWTRLIGRHGRPYREKVEGLVVDDDLRGGWVLIDPDDPRLPTELARVDLKGFGKFDGPPPSERQK
jgi:hypothetical protein